MKFANAIQEAALVLADLDSATADSINGTESFDPLRLQKFLQSDEGARGFFVTLLTGNYVVSDEPPAVLIEAMEKASAEAENVLVKNIAMSAATEVVHKRNQDSDNAAGSRRVLARAKNLFRQTRSAGLRARAVALRETLLNRSEEFAAFLGRVNYDEAQKTAAIEALSEALA